MRRLPQSLWFFGAFATIFVLQLIPLVGFFLLIFQIPILSMFFINAGFIGLAFEVVTRRIRFAWIAFPLIWFGGYGVLVFFERYTTNRLEAEIVRSNLANRMPLMPDTSLVLEDANQNIDIWQLMHEHDLDVTFVGSSKIQAAREYRFSLPKSCETVDENSQYEDLQISSVSKRYNWRDAPIAKPFCVLSFPGITPERGLYADISSTEGLKLRGTPYTITQLRVRFPGQRVVFKSAFVQRLLWFPMPMIYCGDVLTGGGGRWICGANFMRSASTPLKTNTTTTETIQEALSRIIALKPRKRIDFTDAEIKQAAAQLNGIRQSVLISQLAVLDGAIQKATGDGDQVPVESLRRYPDQLLPRLSAMIAAIERDFQPEEGRRYSNAQQLMRLVKSLPPQAVAPYRARLDRLAGLAGRDRSFNYDQPDQAM